MSDPDDAGSPNGAGQGPSPEPPAKQSGGGNAPAGKEGAEETSPSPGAGGGPDGDTATVPTEGTATGAFATGVMGLVMDLVLPIGGIALGVIALMLANTANKKITASNGRLGGAHLARRGRILGIAAIVGAFVAGILYATFYDPPKK